MLIKEAGTFRTNLLPISFFYNLSLQERVSDLEDEKILQKQASLASASRKIPERLTSTKSQVKHSTESIGCLILGLFYEIFLPFFSSSFALQLSENGYNVSRDNSPT